MDSVTVKAIGSNRANTEVFPLLMVCQDTGAVHIQVAYDYCTGAFLLQWGYFIVLVMRLTILPKSYPTNDSAVLKGLRL